MPSLGLSLGLPYGKASTISGGGTPLTADTTAYTADNAVLTADATQV